LNFEAEAEGVTTDLIIAQILKDGAPGRCGDGGLTASSA